MVVVKELRVILNMVVGEDFSTKAIFFFLKTEPYEQIKCAYSF